MLRKTPSPAMCRSSSAASTNPITRQATTKKSVKTTVLRMSIWKRKLANRSRKLSRPTNV